MTQAKTYSRRYIVKALASAPIALPIAQSAAAAALGNAAFPARQAGRASAPVAVRFNGMPAPTLADPAAMARASVASSLVVEDANGMRQVSQLEYQPFFKTGDEVATVGGGQTVAGGYYDIYGRPIMDRSLPGSERQFFSDCPDGMSLLKPVDDVDKAALGVAGNPVFAVVQYEYTSRNLAKESEYGRLPSPIAVLTFDQNPQTGHLQLVRYTNVDTSSVHGLWITCGASRSPWNTHLSSEEYPTDAFAENFDSQFQAFITNLYGDSAALNDPAKANPYLYNHIPEVTVNADGTGSIVKHFCLGRISHELIAVCPDERTVLMGDDFTNGGAFMFVADQPRDLSAGTLYAAKWQQTSGKGPGSATLQWIRLGHAYSAEIEDLARSLKPADIMDVRFSEPTEPGYTKVMRDGTDNWIKVAPNMGKAAAFLETHRYAGLRGASLGFTKWEGTTINGADKVAYMAMSYIQESMIDGTTDIRVEGPTAGAVYAQNLRSGQLDADGSLIDSDWVPVDMQAVPALIGEDRETPDALGNLANPDRIGNPDNLKYSEELRTLFIGEDSALHVNNFLWAYNVDDQRLERILSAPAGAESTGLQAVDNVNGWTYIMSNFQHPGDWGSPLHDQVKDTLEPLMNANFKDRYAAEVGYIAGLPGQTRSRSTRPASCALSRQKRRSHARAPGRQEKTQRFSCLRLCVLA